MSPTSSKNTISGNTPAILPDNAIDFRNNLIRSVLSYRIVKSHAGEIFLNSDTNIGTEFIIRL